MFKKFIFFILLAYQFCFSQEKLSQENSTFNDAVNTYLRNQKNITNQQLVEVGDSLYKSSKNDWQKVKSLFVIIGAYDSQFEYKKALDYSLEANSIAEKNKLIFWKTRTSGQIATLYAKIGFTKESIKYFDKALIYAADLDKKNELLSKSMILQAKSFVYQNQKNFRKILEINKEAVEIIKTLKKEFPNDNFQGSAVPAFINTATSYFHLEDYKNAKIYYKLALDEIKNSEALDRNFYAQTCIKIAMNELKLDKPDFNFTVYYLKKAKEILKITKDKELELEINTTEADYYRLKNKYKTVDSINIKINDSYKNLADLKIKSIEKVFNDSQNNYESEKKKSSNLIIYLYICITIVIISTLLYFYDSKRKKKHFNTILEKINNKDIFDYQLKTPLQNKEKRIMSEEKELELLNKINEFEKGNHFTQKNFSMSQMSTLLETNRKYINYILNNYKNQNFSDYINSLRIKYIIQLLINDSNFLNYKISYLSEISGFSSHSRFTHIFKKEVNISPSEFISQLKRKNK